MSLVVSAGVTMLWLVLLGLHPALCEAPQMRQDPVAQTVVQKYIHEVANQGESQSLQGVWLQSDRAVLAQYQGTEPLPVASLTKIATTLAALHAWGPTHQFKTTVYTTGPVRQGVLRGDLIVQGGGDPFFVSEDAIELRQSLRQLGVEQVTGKLVIAGDFYMNFTTSPILAGNLLKQALQNGAGRMVRRSKRRRVQMVKRHKTSELAIAIAGPVQTVSALVGQQTPLIRRRSLPLVQILKRMNVYSNNAMAEMLTRDLGGPEMMVQHAALAANVPAAALHLINGSGLGAANQLAPRTVCALLMAIHSLLRPTAFTIADVFPIAGYDLGTIRRRHLPDDAVVKTGTLRNVSTLAGVILTRVHGPVWFALLNQGGDLESYRAQQDVLLRALTLHWGAADRPPPDFSPTGLLTVNARNDILLRTRAEGG
jgi:D-alanyl-D-alanine carboxypeptidase/D-alanyl-D-alanine-endopeptidase (penicillin-binding protein 4)